MPARRCSAPRQKSRGSISVFEPEMDQQIRDRRVLHQDLSVAIKNGELSLHYQPQADVGPDGRRPARSSASRRWRAGCIRCAASSRRAISFRSRKKAA